MYGYGYPGYGYGGYGGEWLWIVIVVFIVFFLIWGNNRGNNCPEPPHKY